MTEPEQWARDLEAQSFLARHEHGPKAAALTIQRAFEERAAIFRQIGRWEMAQETAFYLETPVKDCTPGAPEQPSFNAAAKLVSMTMAQTASREFCKMPVHVQFHEGEWGQIIGEVEGKIATLLATRQDAPKACSEDTSHDQ